jgi:hypothetical protein
MSKFLLAAMKGVFEEMAILDNFVSDGLNKVTSL